MVQHFRKITSGAELGAKIFLAKVEHMFYTAISMRIACVYIPHFHVQVERLRTPRLKKRPVIIGGLPDEKASVIDCSDEAEVRGVRPGMELREAHHLCPKATFLTFDRELAEEVWEEVLYTLGAFSLRMEPKEQGLVYLDITKALKLYASEEYLASTIVEVLLRSFQLTVLAGVGNSRFIAEQAALCAPRSVLVVRAGTEKEFVASLHVDRLPVDEEVKERLRLLGLSRLEKVARLSRQAIISQFGSAGACISDIVQGVEDKRQIFKRYGAVSVEKEIVGDAPFETMEQFAAALDSALNEVSAGLKKMGRVCRKVKLTLAFRGKKQDRENVERTFVLKKPTAEADKMLARIVNGLNGLEGMTIGNPITGFIISASDLGPGENMQELLFRKRKALREELKGVKGYLEAMYGHTPLFMVREGEGNSLLPERRFVFSKI
jgi:DNA polymerase-4